MECRVGNGSWKPERQRLHLRGEKSLGKRQWRRVQLEYASSGTTQPRQTRGKRCGASPLCPRGKRPLLSIQLQEYFGALITHCLRAPPLLTLEHFLHMRTLNLNSTVLYIHTHVPRQPTTVSYSVTRQLSTRRGGRESLAAPIPHEVPHPHPLGLAHHPTTRENKTEEPGRLTAWTTARAT
jgi:hypothetical protein